MDEVKRLDLEYFDLLRTNPQVFQRDEIEIRNKLLSGNFTCNGKPIQISIKPYFIKKSTINSFSSAAKALSGMLEKVTKLYLGGYQFDGLINVSNENLKDLVKVFPGYASTQVVQRMDLFFNPETQEFKFNEFNCSDPSGLGYQELLTDILSSSMTMRHFNKMNRLEHMGLLERHCQILLSKYSEYCSTRKIKPKVDPVCAVTCYKQYMTSSDFGIINNYYNKFGLRSRFADSCAFEYNGRELLLDNEPVDIVYRDSMLDFAREDLWPKAKVVMDAYKDGKICLINPVASIIGGYKTVMAILSDVKYSHLFSSDEVNIANRYIPWTRVLGEYRTEHLNRSIDLMSHVLINKDEFVLKPSVGYGGAGVVIGRDVTSGEWNNAIDDVLQMNEKYIVQEYIEVTQEDILTFDDELGEHLKDRRYVGLGLWVFDHIMAGVYVRMSRNKVINVSQGGGLLLASIASDR